jgi:HSP20 family molecular chaperone IbpA
MKRLYVKICTIFLILAFSAGAFADQRGDQIKRREEIREEVHQRIRDMLLNGKADDPDMFKDLEEELGSLMSDSFSGLNQLRDGNASNYKSEWLETKLGRTLAITPKDQNQKINIDVNATVITIKGESQQKTATSVYSSAFTNSFPVPDDCDGTRVKMNSKDGKLLIELPFKSLRAVKVPAKKEEERKALPPLPGAVEI